MIVLFYRVEKEWNCGSVEPGAWRRDCAGTKKGPPKRALSRNPRILWQRQKTDQNSQHNEGPQHKAWSPARPGDAARVVAVAREGLHAGAGVASLERWAVPHFLPSRVPRCMPA